MIFKTLKFLVSILLLVFLSVAKAQTFDEVVESNKWLQLVDSGKYSESWNEAGSFFKQQITQEKWTKVINDVRTPLGKTVSRKKLSSKEYSSLPNAPKGKYIVIQFNTVFQNKKESTETLTFTKSNERWGVVGYFIK